MEILRIADVSRFAQAQTEGRQLAKLESFDSEAEGNEKKCRVKTVFAR